MKLIKYFFPILILLFFISACTKNNQNSISGNSVNEGDKMSNNNSIKYAVIETDKGIIKAELYIEKAPITTKNFIELTNSGFYNGLTFHRVEPGFVVQGGDPKGDGTGGSGKKIPLEINPELKHVKGALAMARTSDPNSATSQFYITLEATSFLDGNYAVFGKVVSGMDVVEKIKVGDKMNKVSISEK